MYTFSENFKSFHRDNLNNDSADKLMNRVVEILFEEGILHESFKEKLSALKVENINSLKSQSLKYLISFAHYILRDNFLSEDEISDFEKLKRIFKIKEGDFIRFQKFEISEILKMQFIRMYSDNFIDKKEAIEKVNLQALFDLSYDEFENLKKDEVIKALENGAKPEDLDIAKLPKGFEF